MKKSICLLVLALLSSSFALAQKEYEMVVKKTDGTEIVTNVEDIAQIYFREQSGSSKRVVKITQSGTSSIFTDEFTYDSQGRVIKIVGKKNGNKDFEEEYIYSETLIICNHTYYNSSGSTSTSVTRYVVDNGRIVSERGQNSDSDRYTYTYDSDGRLSSVIVASETSKAKEVVWKNGNIVKIGSRNFEYGNLSWCNPIGFTLKGSDMEAALVISGYYGKMPKNMPTMCINGESGSVTTYEYSTSGGVIVMVTITEGDDIDVATIEWN